MGEFRNLIIRRVFAKYQILAGLVLALSIPLSPIHGQKLQSDIAYRNGPYGYFSRGERHDSELRIFNYLLGSRLMLLQLQKDHEEGYSTSESFQEWIDTLTSLQPFLNSWMQSIVGGRVFVDVAFPLVDPFQPYYFSARTVECEGEAGAITVDFEGVKELAKEYASQELVDYFDLKTIEPGIYGYDCEGQSINLAKVEAVQQKSKVFLENYPGSKYASEIKSFLSIADRDHALYLERKRKK